MVEWLIAVDAALNQLRIAIEQRKAELLMWLHAFTTFDRYSFLQFVHQLNSLGTLALTGSHARPSQVSSHGSLPPF